MTISGQPLKHLQSHHYQGRLYPVNPRYPEVGGVKCYPSLAEVPETPDLVLILVNAARSLCMRRLLHHWRKREPGMYSKIIVPVAMDQLERGEAILRRAVSLLAEGGEIRFAYLVNSQ